MPWILKICRLLSKNNGLFYYRETKYRDFCWHLTYICMNTFHSQTYAKKKIAKRKTKVFQKVFYLPSFRTVFNFPQCKLVVYASREEMSNATCSAPSHAPRATSSELALIKRASICFLSCRRTSKKCFKFNDTQEEGEEVLY